MHSLSKSLQVIFDHNNVCHTKISIELTSFPRYDAFLTSGRNYGADGAYMGSSPGAPVLLNWLLGGGGYVEYIQPLVNSELGTWNLESNDFVQKSMCTCEQ
jgi:hypothetical protein